MMKLYFIGSSSLLLNCVKQALDQGLTVKGIISADLDIKRWADEHHISMLSLPDLIQQPKNSFDYLFSIVNPIILKKSLLTLPKHGTINFHDGPLPRYAGVHATSWAILNNEKQHAITWHFIDKGIDTGDILVQANVPILSDDTAYAFNLRCFNQALEAFTTLLKKIKQDTIPIPQILSKRTYFPYAQKPIGNGIIDWSLSAETIDRLVRATNYGHHPNDFASAKCCIDGRWFILPSLCIRDASSVEAPGAIAEIHEHHVYISTASHDICIHELLDLNGKKIKLNKLIDELKQKKVTHFNQLTATTKIAFQTFSEKIFNAENFWVNELKKVQLAQFPFHTLQSKYKKTKQQTIQWSITKCLRHTLEKEFPTIPLSSILLSVLMLYLYRINQQDLITVGLYQPITDPLLHPSTAPLACFIRPFNSTTKGNISVKEWIEMIHRCYRQVVEKEPFLKDIFYRYRIDDVLSNAITLHCTDELSTSVIKSTQAVQIQITTKGLVNWFIPQKHSLLKHIDRVLKHLEHLLNKIIESPSEKINFVSIVLKSEYKQIKKLNQTAVDFPANKTLYELFIEQVKKYPHKKAIIGDVTHPLTYQTLWNQTKKLAAILQQKGVKKGMYVGIWMNRSSEAIISMLAITAIGAAYIPLRIKDPIDRITKCLKKASSHYILTRETDLNQIDGSLPNAIQMLNVTRLLKTINHNVFKLIPLDSSKAAYANYTSGTTGEPKGIVISHRNIIRLVKNQNYFHFESDNTIAHTATLAFDATTFEVWGALLNGATIYVIPSRDTLNLEQLQQRILHCTILFTTTALLNQLIQHKPSLFDKLHYLFFGGETCDASIIKLLYDRSKGEKLPLRIVHVYGPTENTTFSTYYPVKSMPNSLSTLPIGRPIHNTTAFVLDKYQQLLPLNVTGELYLGDAGLAKGYLNDDKETQRSFLNTPWGRLYKTGDLVTLCSDTLNLFFEGRVDFQVKLRGFRIELEDIRTHLLKQKAIKQALVHPIMIHQQKKLVAFLVLNIDQKTMSTDKLYHSLKKSLPGYMIPSKFIILNKLPIQQTGKIDYQELNQLMQNQLKSNRTNTAQTNVLFRLIEDYLHVQNITGDQSYQSLGGDSITTMQIVSKAQEQGLVIDPIVLFEAESLNQVLQESTDHTNDSNLATNITAINELSPIQYWFFRKALTQPNYFNQFIILKLNKPCSITVMENYLNKIIEAHPILNSRFDSNSVAFIPNTAVKIKFTKTNPQSYAKNLTALLIDLQKAIDINKGRLLQAGMISSHPQKILILMIHHLVIDGVSWRILLDDLAKLMKQQSRGEPLSLIPEKFSYLTWIDYIHKKAKHFYVSKEVNYWLSQCPNKKKTHSSSNIQKNARDKSEKFSNLQPWYRHGLSIHDQYYSPFVLLLTQTIRALSLWDKQSEVFITLECHGRYPLEKQIDLSRTIGWFTALYPFYIDLKEIYTDKKLLSRIQKMIFNVPTHGIGYGILKELHQCESIKKLPTPVISFNYFGNFDHSITSQMQENFDFDEKGIQLYRGSANRRENLLDITCYVYQKNLHLNIQYNQTLFPSKKITQLFNTFRKGFNQMDILFHQEKSFLPLSFMQQGLLFHSIEHARSAIYWVRVKWHTFESLDIHLYKQAWETLLEQYPQLNVSIQWKKKGELTQVLSKKILIPWRFIDATHETKTKRLLWERQKPIIRPIDQPPLLTVTVVKLSGNHYITVFDHHHALLDGWSLGLLLNTLYKNYRAIQQSQQITITVPIQASRDYITWLSNIKQKHAKHFWLKYLQETPPLLSLGVERNKEAKPEKTIHRREIYTFSTDEITQVTRVAKQYNVTTNVIFQTAWAILLSLYTNQDDIVFGMTFSLRNAEIVSITEQVGLYINTLPCRVCLTANKHICDIWNQLRKDIHHILKYGYVSLIDLHRWFQASIPTVGFFNFLYVFENFPFTLNKFFKKLKIYDPTHYPLSVSIEARDQHKIIITYDANLYSNQEINKILKHYLIILNKTIETPNTTIANIDLLTKEEKQKAILIVKNKKTPYPNLSVFNLFKEQVNKNPNRIAIKYNEKLFSYLEVYNRATKAAIYFSRNNIRKGDHIGVYLNKIELSVVAILGLLKIGAIYVPIDLSYPIDRIKHITKTAKIKKIITDFSLRKKIQKEFENFNLFVIFNKIRFLKIVSEDFTSNLSSNDLMYIMFTSGSTGIPKGVMVTHTNVINILSYFKKKIPISQKDIVLNNTILSFDISVLEVFGALTTGATLLLVDSKIISNPFLYKTFLEKENPTILQMTPSGWRRIIQTEWRPLKSMKLLSGGEALPEDLASSLLEHVEYIWNVYGPTETTIWSTAKKINDAKKITIGKEIFNTQIFVISYWNIILPYGIAGELCIGGDGVTPGYINNLTETKKRFIKLKIDEKNSILVYKTGDKVKQLKNGELIFLGRIDAQIKKYGYRIELGEIETQLLKYKNIKNVAVFFDTSGENISIKAYIEPKNVNTFSTDLLTPYLFRFLPNYMIPNQYIIVDKIPRLANGKTDRHALKNFKDTSHQVNKKITKADYSLMLNLWAEILSKEDIELDDNFFKIGGNSLIALNLLINIEKSFSRKVKFTQLIQHPTPRELMDQLYQCKKNINLVQKTTIPNPILRLNRVRSGKNIFLIHPIGGHVFWFASLAQYIEHDWNVYAIQDPGIITGNVYFLRLEEMCQFYQHAIKKIQPKGPYYLGGASFGATAAFEIAKQLSRNKEKVNFVGLFDGWAKYPKKINSQKFMLNAMWRQYHEMKNEEIAGQSFLMKPIIDIHWQRSNMLAEYKIEYVPLPLTLFKSIETIPIFKKIDCDDNGWKCYTNHLDIIKVPGNHESMFYGDNVCTLGKTILDCLRKFC